MADNQEIDNGELGTFEAVADEITSPYTGGTAKAQGVKLLGGAANSNEVIEGTAANGLEVDVTRIAAGTNNIGDVDVLTEPALDVSTDQAGSALMTNVILDDRTELTPKFFSESVTASDTDEELVALVSAKKLRVLALAVHCGGTATDVTFESSTTTRKHKVPAGINGGQILPFNPVGWFETAAGESLTVTTGAGSTVEISGVYIEV